MPTNLSRLEDKLSKPFQDHLASLESRIESAETTLTETASSTATEVTLTGINGVQAYGSAESGFTVDGQADQHILASQIFGA